MINSFIEIDKHCQMLVFPFHVNHLLSDAVIMAGVAKDRNGKRKKS